MCASEVSKPEKGNGGGAKVEADLQAEEETEGPLKRRGGRARRVESRSIEISKKRLEIEHRGGGASNHVTKETKVREGANERSKKRGI